MDPKPFIEFDDPNLTDRQMLLLLLYEIIELKSEVRTISNLLLQAPNSGVSSETFGKLHDSAQDDALEELRQHVKMIALGLQKPGQN